MEDQDPNARTAVINRRMRDDLLNLLSLAAFFGITALLFRSWEFALIVTASLGFHELGHVAVLALSGLEWHIAFGFAGAWTWSSSAQRQQLTHLHNALIHLMGPFFSLLLALLAIAIYTFWRPEDGHLLLLANFSAQLGFLNLIPIGEVTDGGKIVRRLAASYPPGHARGWAVLLPLLVSVLMLVITALAVAAPRETLLSLLLAGLWLSGSQVIEMVLLRHQKHKDRVPLAQARISPTQGYMLVTILWAQLVLSLLIIAATPFWLTPHYLWGSLNNITDVLYFIARTVVLGG